VVSNKASLRVEKMMDGLKAMRIKPNREDGSAARSINGTVMDGTFYSKSIPIESKHNLLSIAFASAIDF